MSEKEAIEELEGYAQNHSNFDEDVREAIDIVLNLMQSQQKEIEKYKYLYQKALNNTIKVDKDNIKKDKLIDEMLETLRYYNGMQQEQCFCIDICDKKECDMKNCKNRIKQYFEKKVDDNNE